MGPHFIVGEKNWHPGASSSNRLRVTKWIFLVLLYLCRLPLLPPFRHFLTSLFLLTAREAQVSRKPQRRLDVSRTDGTSIQTLFWVLSDRWAPHTLCLDYSVFFPSCNVTSVQPNDKVEQGGNYRVWITVVFEYKPSLPFVFKGLQGLFFLSFVFCFCLYSPCFLSVFFFPSIQWMDNIFFSFCFSVAFKRLVAYV